MKIGANIEARVSATLAMTPRLQQAIRLLQLSVTELSVYVNEQVSENPLLTIETGDESLPTLQEDPQEFSLDCDDFIIPAIKNIRARIPCTIQRAIFII